MKIALLIALLWGIAAMAAAPFVGSFVAARLNGEQPAESEAELPEIAGQVPE